MKPHLAHNTLGGHFESDGVDTSLGSMLTLAGFGF